MSSRNRLAWERPPRLPPTHYVDAAAYSDPGVFADEMDRIMARCWRFASHESELPDPFDFRTVDHAEVPLVLVRGGDRRIRSTRRSTRRRSRIRRCSGCVTVPGARADPDGRR